MIVSVAAAIVMLSCFVLVSGEFPESATFTVMVEVPGVVGIPVIAPVIVIATQEALRTVPISLRQAALALGATRWQMIRDHVLPASIPGILTGTILGLSRATLYRRLAEAP